MAIFQSDIVLANGDVLQVESGVTVANAAVNSGGSMLILSGLSATVHSGTTANDITVMRDGRLIISSGGTASHLTAFSGGRLTVFSGTANHTTINNGGLDVTGGTANFVTVNNGGLSVYKGGTADHVNFSDGNLLIDKDCTVTDATVNSGGCAIVSSGGTANHATVNYSGGLDVRSGGRLNGKIAFEEGAYVSMIEGAAVDFDLTQAEAGSVEALVNDLSIIQGTPVYTLTVEDEWKPGSYTCTLADGAAGFESTISVVNKAGNALGSLIVGETVKVGYDDYTLNLADGTLSVSIESPDLTPQEPVTTPEKVSWETTGAEQYIVEYSTDDFEHVIQVVTNGSAVDMPELPGGTYQCRVKADANSGWTVGETIVSEAVPDDSPKVVQAVEDGSDDLFFASTNGTWSRFYYAQHVGSINDWTGTNEVVSASGKGRIQNLYFGSADPNVLCLTDSENGDAIFVDDAFTGLPEEVEKNTARLYRIHEIRAGAGDDIVDMTSQRCEYTGDGLTIRGGDGDDTIWANKGDNMLFGDAGNDRLVGGIGDDSMHGGGGDDVFTFCDNWGTDTVEQLETGTVTLWFASGKESNWNAETLTYTSGGNSVTVSGVAAEQVTLKFGVGGPDDAEQFAILSGAGAFDGFTSRRVFEE